MALRKLTPLVVSAMLAACGSSSAGGDGDGDGDGDSQGPFGSCSGTDTDDVFDGDVQCFGDPADPTNPGDPLLVIEAGPEIYNGVPAIHVRLIFSPLFVDNTFGTGSVGWGGDHKFDELVGSDHAQVQLYDAADALVFDLKLDYISEDPAAPCGYSSGGVAEGDGKIDAGDEAAILGWSTSLDENLNARGLCLTEDSPATDATCTPDPAAAEWDFRVIYDLWVAASAFDPAGFGRAVMESVHASPSKGDNNTIEVEPIDCPTDDFDGCLDPADGCPDGGGCPDGCDTGEFCSDGVCVPEVG